MRTEALIWLLSVQGTVTAATLYFFYKVIKADKNMDSQENPE
ncbi:MAG: hypothetical protein RIC35_23240 [Marinoscillum sp.]